MKPIYLTENDITVMDKQTKRDVLAHNKSWQVHCKHKLAKIMQWKK